ncbi:bis-aminopropyl spermidine synthase family protein [Deinococcus saxicola]|uniref:bis-aminopropyl spermidine synthase family protein n=1 Tax=Deinococcus saxicola TaxID=249406 RepID=UPI0039EF155C
MIPSERQQLEEHLLDVWEAARPPSLREYDQIPMVRDDLLASVKAAAPQLAGKRVAFMGDHDGVSVVLGMLVANGLVPAPLSMRILDFDERLLIQAEHVAARYGFSHLLNVSLYNAFDAVPASLVGKSDAYYTNPPYGMSNAGASVRLFMTRGMELASRVGARGYVVLPYDCQRSWTQDAKEHTFRFVTGHGWDVVNFVPEIHSYHLDDDPHLKSALLTIEAGSGQRRRLPWQGRGVDHHEIAHFYGRSVLAPYPRYLLRNQTLMYMDKAAS